MSSVVIPRVKWQFEQRCEETEQLLQQEVGVSPLVSIILAQRGIDTPERARRFLHPTLADLHPPELLPDFDLAAAEILGAIERQELIFVHGDYDVDGVTSTALFTRFLRKIGAQVECHVPHRTKEGYGVHADSIERAKQLGVKLFITCDCGITAHEQVSALRDAGIRVVVTDHHEPNATLPDAHAVVNPHRQDSNYPFNSLCGAGVVLKLCAGIAAIKGISPEHFYRAYLDLATMGTIADLMPLTDENRTIVKLGLAQFAHSNKIGIKALLQMCSKPGAKVTSETIGFQIAPRINAAGRINDPSLALELLMTQDEAQALRIAGQLNALNIERQNELTRLREEASALVEKELYHEDNVIVIGKEGWHPGLIGLVAGRLKDEFMRPAFVISFDEVTKQGKGSARSIPGFHLAEALHMMSDFVTGGGHELAAGFSIAREHLDDFRLAVNEYAGGLSNFTPGVDLLQCVAEVPSELVNESACADLECLEPFGSWNRQPIFVTRGLKLEGVSYVGAEKQHVKFSARSEAGSLINAVAWNKAEQFLQVEPRSRLDLAYYPYIDTFNGKRSLCWRLSDFTVL